VGVHVQRVVVHGQQAEQVVVVLGDRLARPVPVHRADLELLEITPELHVHLPGVARTSAAGTTVWPRGE